MTTSLPCDEEAIVQGDKNGQHLVYIDCREPSRRPIPYQDLSAIPTGSDLKLSQGALSLFLRFGFYPPPFTPFKGIFCLAMGDTVSETLRYWTDFEYIETKNPETSDPHQFEHELTTAVSRSVIGQPPLSLMLSGGRDSVGLLVTLKELGIKDVTCYTFSTPARPDEAPYARELAHHFGYKHITIQEDPKEELAGLMKAADTGHQLTGDPALASYLQIASYIPEGSLIIDGLGNDVYAGHLPPKRESLLRKTSIPERLGAGAWAIAPQGLGAHVDYALQSAFMYPEERFFSGSKLERNEIGEPGARFCLAYLNYLRASAKGLGEVDARAFLRGRLFDSAMAMEKARIAASTFNSRVTFPYASKQLADYWFQLPRGIKYSVDPRRNKLPLQRYLTDKLPAFEPPKKGSFGFDARQFMAYAGNQLAAEFKGTALTEEMLPLYRKLLNKRKNFVAARRAYLLAIAAMNINRSGSKLSVSNEGFVPRPREHKPKSMYLDLSELVG